MTVAPAAQSSNKIEQVYIWLILSGHLVVLAYFWATDVLSALLKGSEPFCWPYLPDCGQLRLNSPLYIELILLVYLSLIFLVGLFASRSLAVTRAFLIAINALAIGITSLDYRLRANEFYMLSWFNLVFLFWPNKRWNLTLLLVSFYFWAGHLKLNREWLSGSVLYHNLWLIPPRFNAAACAYVVVLEMVMIWGLLSRRRYVRWIVLAQLALFHVESLSQIHWFYPVLMATMLAVLALENAAPAADPDRPSLQVLLTGRAPKSAYCLLVLFGAFQAAPLLYRGDTTLNGQGRLFALHMFEARQLCEVSATLHHVNGEVSTVDLKLPNLPPRIVCDPVIYYSRINNLCQTHGINGIENADLLMKIKRTTDGEYQTIIDEPNFCAPVHHYSLFANTPWLH